jgi:5-methylcytosine-specific restriction endonuclease McrA
VLNAQAKERGKRLRQSEEFRQKEKKRGYDWYQNNKARATKKVRDRQIAKMLAQPKWLSAIQQAQIQEFYEIAEASKMQTGIPHHVDHILALNGKGFRGLHVPWNLQVLTASMNDSKGTKVPKELEHLLWSAA